MGNSINNDVVFSWMNCPNQECRRLIVKGLIVERADRKGIPAYGQVDEWIVLPRRATRRIDPLVPEQYGDKYRQAAAILDGSAGASAGLSRLILADLLADRGGYTQFKLSSRINAFIDDRSNPRPLRENLHYLREIADFGVHTQKDEATGAIIDVSQEEAEWCLEVIDRLFDYYVVGPAQDEKTRLAFDEKLSRAGRKAIAPLPEDDNGYDSENQEKP